LASAGTVTAKQPTGDVISRPAKWISGGPTDADNRKGKFRGAVVVQFTVAANGRVANCTTARGSGDAKMDALTCRILTERGRFEPARDARGQPVSIPAHATYVWGRGRRPKT
jgi:protein TonB